MRNDVFLIFYFLLQAHWVAGAIAAHLTGTLTQNQYRMRGARKAMGYLRHQGMWSDVYSVHPYLSLTTALLWSSWTNVPAWLWICSYIAALFIGRTIQRAWSGSKEVIESHNEIEEHPGRGPTAAGKPSYVGWAHVPHIALIIVLGVSTLVSSCFGYVPWRLVVAGVLIFAGHAFAGQHWLLRHMNPLDNPWPRTNSDGMKGILNIICTSLGIFFVFWQLVVSP